MSLKSVFALSRRELLFCTLITIILTVSIAPAFASVTLDIDTDVLFTNINTFLPVAFAVFGVIGGLMIAFRLARFLVNAFADALDGKSI